MKAVLTTVERDAQAMEVKQKRCGACNHRGELINFLGTRAYLCSIGQSGFQDERGQRCKRFSLDDGGDK